MGNENRQKNIGLCIPFFLFACILRNGVASGNRILAGKAVDLSEDDDIVECIDIYKQPAFDHPLLKNHTIQLKPSSYPSGFEARKFNTEIFESWKNKYGECPEGKIPIVRSQVPFPPKSMPPGAHRSRLNQYAGANKGHEYAVASISGDRYYGASAGFNVWHPEVESLDEFSVAQVWIAADRGENCNTIEAGWQVFWETNTTRLFIYWTRDGYRSTGCHNLECPGFVQTNPKFGVGGALNLLSNYGGIQYEEIITIRKDPQSGNWWLNTQGDDIGYWPSTIFTSLANNATDVVWGGEIINSAPGRHTRTQMGSGHFPVEGFGKASYIRQLKHIDGTGNLIDAGNLQPYVTNANCYDVQIPPPRDGLGVHIFYGGPGYSDRCP